MNPPLPAPKPPFRVARFLIALLAVTLMAVTAFALLRAGAFYYLYTWLFARVVESTGLDLWVSRAITLALVTLAWLLPWQLFVLPWIGGNRTRVAVLVLVASAALAAMAIVTRDVYFSRTDGRPLKYYIQTLDGYKFATAGGTDPVYGLPYQLITAEVARAYILWKARGGQMQDPSVPAGRYFSPSTGEPLRWYARLPDGRIDLFTLPGFHPTYGIKLLPVTPDIVAEFEKQKTAAERQTQDEAKARQRREAAEARRQAEEANSKAREASTATAWEALRPGRYVLPSPRPAGTIAGFHFALAEVDLITDRVLMHVDVENVGGAHAVNTIRFGLLKADGALERYAAVRAKEGEVADRDGSVTFPGIGKRGAFVMEFHGTLDLRPTFSLIVNDQPLLSGINLHKAAFAPF